MAMVRYRLTLHGFVERNILVLLRAFAAGVALPDARAVDAALLPSLERLAARAVENGFVFCDGDTVHVGPGELKLLGWLALLQREHPVMPAMPFGPALHEALQGCADAFAAQGIRLPWRAIVRAGLAEAGAEVRTLKDKAVAYARMQGIVSAGDLTAIGVSRQYLRKIRLEGALIRVRHGLYRAADQGPIPNLSH